MSGIDNNTIFYLRGDSLKDLSLKNIPIVNQGTTIVNKSINLDSGYFTCNTGFQDINTTKYWTIEWCEYSTQDNTNTQCGLICNKPFTSYDYGGILLGYNGTNLFLSSTQGAWNVFNSTSAKDKPLNTWVHWAFVRNDSSFTMYKNGVKFWSGTSSALPYVWDNHGFGVGMWYASNGLKKGYKANIKNLRISNITRYTQDFIPQYEAFNSLSINVINQTKDKIDFNISKLGQEVVNKIEVLVNGQVSKTYTSIGDLTYNIDKSLCIHGINNLKIKVTFDNDYTEEKEITFISSIDKIPTSSSLKELIDRQELLTNSIEVQKNNLKSILESKNVVVSEGENKLSILIQKVNDLRDYQDGKLWLYKDGDECTSITGGWVQGVKKVGTLNTFTKKSNSMYFNCKGTAVGPAYNTIYPANDISSLLINKIIYIECDVKKSTNSSTQKSYIAIASSNNVKSSEWWDYSKGQDSYNSLNGINILEHKYIADSILQIIVSGESSSNEIELEITKIWAEGV